MRRKTRIAAKKALTVVLSAAMFVSSIGSANVTAAEKQSAAKTVRLDPTKASTFHDTNDDGLGEFEGFGTSLCWWANRIGNNAALTEKAGKLFFNVDEGLGMNIGRYNIGGGDLVGDVKVPEAKPNPKALIYDVVTSGHTPSYDGKQMNVNTVNFGETKFKYTDPDFGFIKDNQVGSFKYVGWINKLTDEVGDGDKLTYTIEAPETGDYTVKILMTLTGNNSRDVALRVMEENAGKASKSYKLTTTLNEVDDEDIFTEEVDAKKVSEESKEKSDEVTSTEETQEKYLYGSVGDDTDSSEVDDKESSDTNGSTREDESKDASSVEISSKEESSAKVDESQDNSNEKSSDKEAESQEASSVENHKENFKQVEKAALKASTREMQAPAEDYKDYVVNADQINANQIANGGNNKLYIATIKNVKLVKGANTVLVAGQNDWTLDFIKMAVIKAGDEASVEELENNGQQESQELPEFFHGEHIIRSDSAVPGYCVNVTRMDTSKKTIAEYTKEFDRVDETSGFAWNYDWDADKGQINVLKAAIKNSGSDFIAEMFSNSPPYFMTVSGCSSGNTDANKDNLRPECYEAFAKYMADVMEHWTKKGITFQSATPMNEPYTNYWAARSNKQEGCHFEKGESQSKIFVALRKELDKKGLQDVILSASDETSIDTAITTYKALSDEAKKSVERIDTHSYGGSKRGELKNLAIAEGKNLWMSEVDGSVTAGENAGQMSAALGIAGQMMTDINGLKASAWIFWNAIDMHVDSSDYGKSWVDKGSSNDFLSKDQLYSRWMAKESNGYWGLAAANHDTNEIYLTKKYYGFGQFSKYIRPGYTIIGSTNEGKFVTAYDPKDNKVVIVALNTTAEDEAYSFDLSLFNEMSKNASVKAVRTSGSLESGENWADVSKNDDIVINVDAKTVAATLKANSITTYIIDGVTYDPKNPVSDEMTEIKIPRSAISGSAPWSGGTGCDVDKLIDNDFGTFFDGVTNGYVIVDLGTETSLAAISFAPRSGYTDRAEGAMIAGSHDGKDWTKLYTIKERPSAGALTYIYSSEFAGGNNKFRYIKYYVEGEKSNCNVAELKFYTKEPRVASVETVMAVAAPGKVPTLPTRVEGQTTTGEKHSFLVEWNIDQSKFKNTKLLDVVTVEGSLVGNNLEAEAKVLIAPANLEYFVDCNLDDSESFKIAKAGLKKLKNTTPDQVKTDDTTWGRLAKYGSFNGDSTLGSGWYAYSKQDIEYSFQLPAGSHEVTLSASGVWWSGTSRRMQVTYEVDGKEKNLCTLNTEKNKDTVSSGNIELEKASDVVIRLKKADGENQDPILTWITIEGPVVYEEGTIYKDGTVNIADTTENGEKILWDTEDIEVTSDLFKYMTITGAAKDTTTKGKVLVVPKDLEYFISCNDADCDEWKLVCKSENLLNKDSADQKKTDSNSWGRVKDYGTYNDESSPASGGFYSSTPIEYVLPLTAGVHDIFACANGYWWSQWTPSRSMDVTYEVDGVEKPLFTLKTKENEEVINSGKIILSKDAEVTVRIKKAANEKSDSIISWLAISNNSTLSFTGTTGDQMYDIDGNRIQAHGGQIQKLGDTWYWVGEDKTEGYQPCPGVHMYSSKDLYNWKDEGVVLKTMTSYDEFERDDYFKKLYGGLNDDQKKLIYTDLAQGDKTSGYKTVIERPKMLYNEKTDKYVIWFHADGKSPYESSGDSNYAKAKAGIAIADNPTGPYTLLGSYLLASGVEDHGFDKTVGGHVRDMNLFKDDDGTAYVLYSSEGNAVMYVAKLNDSYTGLVKDADKMELGKDFAISSTDSREAPAMFKYENKYYLITSGCTGWSPNQARYAVADSPLGPWTNMGDPCVGDSSNLTFRTQSTCVIPVDPEKGKFIYMGDRWFENQLADSRYVWLPIEFGSDNTIMIRDYKDWTLDNLENKASIKVNDTLTVEASGVKNLLASLPSELSVTSAGTTTTSKVEWNVDQKALALDENYIGEVVVNGTLTDLNRKVQCKVLVSPEKLVYLTDCYTNTEDNTSEMFRKISGRSKYLINTVSDQAYAKDPNRPYNWGYVSVANAEDANSKVDMGSKGVGDFYDTGWWATATGSISYAYDLAAGKYTIAAGFNEWWSATREMTINVIGVDKDGVETTLGSTSFTMKNDKGMEKLVKDIEVPENTDHVIVRVSKKSGADPILSWIGIIAENPSAPAIDQKPSSENAGTGSNNNQGSSAVNNASGNSTATTNKENKQNLISKIVEIIEENVAKQDKPEETKPAKKKAVGKTPAVTEIIGEKVNDTVVEEKQETVEETNATTETMVEAETELHSESVAEEDVTIEDTQTPLVESPKTKNTTPIVVAIIGAAVALSGAFMTLVSRKRRK